METTIASHRHLQKKTTIFGISLLAALLLVSLAFPETAQAMPWDDWVNDVGNNISQWVKGFLEGIANFFLSAVADVTNYFSAKEALNASFDSILTRGNGTSNAYTVIAGLKTSVIIVGQSILAFALLMQLVKISQRVDANGTMPVVKEILILAVFFFIGSYLVNHSFDICTAAYDEINKLISEVTSNNNRQTIGGIVLGDTTSVDEGAMLGIVIAIMIMWLFSFLGSIIGIALIMARAIQLYVMAACSPIPFSLLLFDETRQMGIGFCKSFLSVCLAGLILAVLMMIYPTLIGDVLQAAASPDGTGKYTLDITNYWKASIPIVACSFMYLYALLKSGAWARDILGG